MKELLLCDYLNPDAHFNIQYLFNHDVHISDTLRWDLHNLGPVILHEIACLLRAMIEFRSFLVTVAIALTYFVIILIIR